MAVDTYRPPRTRLNLAGPPAASARRDDSNGPLLLGAAGLTGLGLWLWLRHHGIACPPAETLVKGTPSGRWYVITADGHKRYITPAAVGTCGYDPAHLVGAADADLANCPDGPDVTGPPDCPPAPVLATQCPLTPRTLVRDGAITPTPAGPPIYIITDDCHKRWVRSTLDCGYDFSQTKSVTAAELLATPSGPDVTGVAGDCPPGPMPSGQPAGNPSAACVAAGNIDGRSDCVVCYRVQSGDILITVVQAHYGTQIAPTGQVIWETLYNVNRNTIEAAARAHGFPNSASGHWIFPGEPLCLPIIGGVTPH